MKYSFEYLFKVTKINLFSLRLTHKLARPMKFNLTQAAMGVGGATIRHAE